MTVYLFQSAPRTDMFGFTFDPNGENLPAEMAPWKFAGSTARATIDALVMVEIKRKGFYLTRSASTPIDPQPSNETLRRAVSTLKGSQPAIANPVVD
jgi:hypothetical protein